MPRPDTKRKMPAATVTLEWKDHGQNLTSHLWNFFKERYLVDVNVVCRGRRVKVHRLVLEALFPAFGESLAGRHQSQKSRDGLVQDVTDSATADSDHDDVGTQLHVAAGHEEDVGYLMEFIYTGKITEIPFEHLSCLLNIAEEMGLKALATVIQEQKNLYTEKTRSTTCGKLAPCDLDHNDQDGLSQGEMEEDTDGMLRMLLSPEVVMENTDSTKRSGTSERLDKVPALPNNECEHVGTGKYSFRTSRRRRPVDSGVDAGDHPNLQEAGNRTQSRMQHSADNVDRVKTSTRESISRRKGKSPSEKRLAVTGDGSRKEGTDLTVGTAELDTSKRQRLEECDQEAVEQPQNAVSPIGVREDGVECEYCGHRTQHRSVLIQHLAVRHKVDAQGNRLPDIKCTHCDFVCVAKQQLRQHMLRKHTEDKPYKCSQCSYTAAFSSDLKKHVQIRHQHRRDYMCEECGYRSQTRGGLNAHVRAIHQGIKQFRCDLCGAGYADALSFKLHQQGHSGGVINSYVCHVCAHSCPRRSQLRIHLRKKHMIELEPAKPAYREMAPDANVTTLLQNSTENSSSNVSASILIDSG